VGQGMFALSIKRAKEEEERAALARRSQVVQRGLPRPPNIDLERLFNDLSLVPPPAEGEEEAVQRLIDLELAQLMKHDSLTHSIPGTAHPGGTPSTYEPPPDAYVTAAKAAVLGLPNAPEEQVHNVVRAFAIGDDAAVDESASWVRLRGTLVLDTASESWVPTEDLDVNGRAAGYKAAPEERRIAVGWEATREINQMEWEMYSYLEWQLNVDPTTLCDFQARV